jgi:hypothetical protein
MKLTKSQLKEIIKEEIQTINENKEEMMVNIIGSYLSRQYQMGENKSYHIGKELVKLFKTNKLI